MPSLVRTKYGVYHIVTTCHGKHIWQSTHTKDRREATRILLQASVKSAEPGKPDNRMLTACMKEYLAYVRVNFSRKTLAVYSLCLKHLEKYTGDIEIHAVTPRTIDLYKAERARNVSPSTVNIELRCFKAFFNCLKRWGIVAKNPCDGIRPLKFQTFVPPYLTQEALINLLRSSTDRWLNDIIPFTAMTGLRVGEVANLDWADINISTGTAVIKSSLEYSVKHGKSRLIPLNTTALEILRKLPLREGLVFRGKKGERLNPNFISRKFRLTVRSAGFDRRLHFHSLRHTFASLLVTRGASLLHVQKLLGHLSYRVTEIYAHLQHSDLNPVVEGINVPEPALRKAGIRYLAGEG